MALATGLLSSAPLTGCWDPQLDPTICNEDCLIGRATDIATGKEKLSPKSRIVENGQLIAPGKAWFKGAKSIKLHGSYAWLTPGAANAMVVGTGTGADGRPAIFGLRTRIDGTRGAPWEVELLVAHSGEASLFPAAIPMLREPIMDEVVPREHRTSDADMVAAANAYFNGIEAKTGANVPVTPDCERVENGVQTTGNPRFGNGTARCNSLEGFDYIKNVRDRRFPVVDEQHGIVVAAVAFDIPGGQYPRMVDGKQTMRDYKPRSLLLFEAFKIVDGKIRHIQATMRDMPLGAPTGFAPDPPYRGPAKAP
jgi:hypothetical protein